MSKNIDENINLHCSDVDFVVLWVDGNDVEWQKKRAKYMSSEAADISPNRYRDWGTLRYWFRGVAEFAPWVNKIHFVSDGQVPEWLNTENPHLHVVDHKDFIPHEFLPLFNSSAIEVGIHNIPNLSEKFVYFNDDMFLTSPVSTNYYFRRGLPVDVPGTTSPAGRSTNFGSMMSNNCEVLNRNFSKREVLKRDWNRWMNPLLGKTFIRTCINFNRRDWDGIVIPHLSMPYRRSDWTRVWDREGTALKETQSHRFRTPDDLTHYLFRFWRLAEGDYHSRAIKGKYCSAQTYDSVALIAEDIAGQKSPEMCINDCYDAANFTAAKELLIQAFEKILPNKCEYEK